MAGYPNITVPAGWAFGLPMGLSFMGGGLAVPHGVEEAVLTIIGVTLLAIGHVLNLRGLRQT